jgi:hypothetical protein
MVFHHVFFLGMVFHHCVTHVRGTNIQCDAKSNIFEQKLSETKKHNSILSNGILKLLTITTTTYCEYAKANAPSTRNAHTRYMHFPATVELAAAWGVIPIHATSTANHWAPRHPNQICPTSTSRVTVRVRSKRPRRETASCLQAALRHGGKLGTVRS